MSKTSSGLFAGTIGARTSPLRITGTTPGGKERVRQSNVTDNVKSIPAGSIRFSQTSVNDSKPIIESMKKDGWVGVPVDVVTMPDGGLTTIDNTRVVAAQIAGINVKARVHAYNEPIGDAETARRLSTKKKGTPTTWGEAADYRIAKQNSSFRKSSPTGSFKMGKIN